MVFDEADEARRRLEEAKARLREEKQRLKEEMRNARYGSNYKAQRIPGEPVLKPWMIWDICIVVLVFVLFTTAMFYPRSGIISSNELTGAAIAQVPTTQVNQPVVEEDAFELEETIGEVEPIEEEVIEETTEVPPKFTLSLQDEEGKVLSELLTSAETFRYNIIVKNEESEYIVCDGDRIIDDDRDEDIYKQVKLHPREKEDLTTDILLPKNKRTEVKYEIRCRFFDGNKESTLTAEFDVTQSDQAPPE
ncbi:MAG: hypothetical protein Q8R00_00630 [Candidatus Nanoarchaeia archaeon]|nr:hypothetical protein [Candidatus Nanoarchaeia archaeon]